MGSGRRQMMHSFVGWCILKRLCSLSQVLICSLRWAFWQILSQYKTLQHAVQDFSFVFESPSRLPQLAHSLMLMLLLFIFILLCEFVIDIVVCILCSDNFGSQIRKGVRFAWCVNDGTTICIEWDGCLHPQPLTFFKTNRWYSHLYGYTAMAPATATK